MPHCIIEHSDNVLDKPSWQNIFSKLHKILVDTGEWIESDIKSRVLEHKNFYIGDGSPNQAFVTLNIQILDGRSDSIKKDITQKALNLLSDNFPKTLKELRFSITVQVSNIHPSYCRLVNYDN
jgi:5-carboxymethyl-2-hydroxymuconate isomerase